MNGAIDNHLLPLYGILAEFDVYIQPLVVSSQGLKRLKVMGVTGDWNSHFCLGPKYFGFASLRAL